jgi:putative ABC transport system permease protein
MSRLIQDVRYALRTMGKAPGFTAVVVLTLALGVAANTAIFSVVNALLLRPLPYPDSNRLVMVWQDLRARGGPIDEWATPGNYVDWRADTRVFEGLAAMQRWAASISGDGLQASPLVGEQVTASYFDVLGVAPALGRTFTSQEDVPNAPRVAIISHDLWTSRFGGDPSVIGRTAMLSGEPHEIVGVMPAGFRPGVLPNAVVWRPLRLNVAQPARGLVVLRVVARLRNGLSMPQAASALSALAQQLEREHPDANRAAGIYVVRLQDRVVGDVRPALLVLLGAVAFVLLIACVNVANLLLARASRRSREMAVRIALGAGRGRVVRQLLTESLLLAAIGGVAGIVLAQWAVSGLLAMAPPALPRMDGVRLDGTVLLFVLALIVVTGILFGLAPAWHASRGDVTPALNEGARGSTAGTGHRTRRLLIVSEVALALMLLVGGGLLLRTFVELQHVNLGIDPSHVLTGTVQPPRARYDTPEKGVALYDRLLEKAAALPGVRIAALSSIVPLSGGDSDMGFAIEGRPPADNPDQEPVTWYRLVSADYFRAMGITIRSGRGFTPHQAEPTVLINETLARRYWPGTNPIGKRVKFSREGPWFTITGTVNDVKVRGAQAENRAEMYVPYWHLPEAGISLVLKASVDPESLAGPMREMVRQIDPDLPVSGIASMDTLVADSVAEPRFFASLVGVFAVLALALAAVGIYGVMSYLVAQRTGEIGVRLALGAAEKQIFRLVLGDSLRLTAIGVAVGIAGALAIGRMLRQLLFGVTAADPLTFALTVAVLTAVAVAATYVPARRAMRTDPIGALRQ